MKIIEVEGIVIKEIDYKESSKILNVLTKEYGVIGIVSKGCKKIKSKLSGVSRNFCYGTFHIYYKEDGLSTLIAVDLINSYSNILKDLEKISYSIFLLDLFNQTLKDNNDNNLFYLLKSSLDKINDNFDPLVITNIVEVKLLDFLGVKPSIDSCSICGSDKQIVLLSSYDGGYICKNCNKSMKTTSSKVIKLIRAYYYIDLDNIVKLEIEDSEKEEINNFLNDYYDRFTGLYLKSKNFINNINKLKV